MTCESRRIVSSWSPPGADTEARPSPSLRGREAVVDLIEQQLVRAERGQGARVAVVGDPGVGKSAVLAVLADRWRSRGWRVVEGFGRATDASGYAATADMLRAVSTGTRDESFVERLVAKAPSSPLPDTRRQSSEQSLHLRVARILEAAARVPLLLVVDDLHGADAATSRLLDGLCAIGRTTHWSLLTAARSDAGAGARVVHRLEPLADGVIETIVRGQCPHHTDDAIARAVSRSRGNPLFAHEIAQLLLTGSPPTLVPPSAFELLRERLDALPRPQRALVPLVALAGSDATWSMVSRAVTRLAPGTTPHDFAETVQRLFDAGLVTDHEGLLAPSHPLIGEAALALLNRSRRAALHDALAAALDAGPGTTGAGPHRLAAFEALPDSARGGWAVQAATDAAQHALEQGRNQDAAALSRVALRAWIVCDSKVRKQLHTRLLDSHLMLGHALATSAPAEAEAAYENGRRAARDDDDRARFILAKGWQHYSHGELSKAAHAYQEGLDLAALSPAAELKLRACLGWVLARQGLFERGLDQIDAAPRRVDERTDPDAVALALDRKGMTLSFQGRLTEAMATLDRAYEVGTHADAPDLLAAIQTHRGSVCGRLGDWEQALRYLDEAVQLARHANDVYVESVAWWSRTDVLTRKGDRGAALEANREEERALRLADNAVHLAACLRRRAALIDPGSACHRHCRQDSMTWPHRACFREHAQGLTRHG